MSLCDNCIHDEVCGAEGHCDEGLIFCADMIPKEQEQKIGHWIEHEIEGTLRYLECSNCHYETYNVKHNYCMNCGTKMVEPQAESEEQA